MDTQKLVTCLCSESCLYPYNDLFIIESNTMSITDTLFNDAVQSTLTAVQQISDDLYLTAFYIFFICLNDFIIQFKFYIPVQNIFLRNLVWHIWVSSKM